jgi:hypothetical protein
MNLCPNNITGIFPEIADAEKEDQLQADDTGKCQIPIEMK